MFSNEAQGFPIPIPPGSKVVVIMSETRFFTRLLAAAAIGLGLAAPAQAARLTPVSRDTANGLIAQCRANEDHFILRWHEKSACCTEDANLRATCVVCDQNENCQLYEEFHTFQNLFQTLRQDIQVVAPPDGAPGRSPAPGAAHPLFPGESIFGD